MPSNTHAEFMLQHYRSNTDVCILKFVQNIQVFFEPGTMHSSFITCVFTCICVFVVITDSLPDTVLRISPSANYNLDMMLDQGDRGDGIVSATRYPIESNIRLGQLEDNLNNIKTMLDMLKRQVHWKRIANRHAGVSALGLESTVVLSMFFHTRVCIREMYNDSHVVYSTELPWSTCHGKWIW